jgi:hypothetical protein
MPNAVSLHDQPLAFLRIMSRDYDCVHTLLTLCQCSHGEGPICRVAPSMGEPRTGRRATLQRDFLIRTGTGRTVDGAGGA